MSSNTAELRPPKIRVIPRAGIEMSELGLGCNALGGLFEPTPAQVAFDAVHTSMAGGIRYYDTAPYYGHGLGEERLGQALKRYDRDSYVLGTKIGITINPHVAEGEDFEVKYADPWAFDGVHDFSYDACMRNFEDSLKRLDVDRVDICYIHDPDKAEALLPPEQQTGEYAFEEVLEGAYKAASKLRDEGLIKAIGIGMFGAKALARFAQAADFDVFLLAGQYTLLEHDAIETLLPVCDERKTSLVIGAVMKSGILATGTSVPTPMYDYQPAKPDMIARVKRIEDHCATHGISLGAAALQFPLAHPVVVSVIPGARSPEETTNNLGWINEVIPDEFWTALKAEGLIRPDVPTGTTGGS
jgi:D-threo-aldose 1-dehydrogenase